ncbi:hypothetical protein CDAR_591571 [Caerostris darwini]|uniref:Uncharacterized protein n=1 Tax=Caerostris darwini TaxID=1538125 RepID=A0AAV4PKA0_9ARAC|nr:hypothetical protein CDAR_591571 [Caerostris darwini]
MEKLLGRPAIESLDPGVCIIELCTAGKQTKSATQFNPKSSPGDVDGSLAAYALRQQKWQSEGEMRDDKSKSALPLDL